MVKLSFMRSFNIFGATDRERSPILDFTSNDFHTDSTEKMELYAHGWILHDQWSPTKLVS